MTLCEFPSTVVGSGQGLAASLPQVGFIPQVAVAWVPCSPCRSSCHTGVTSVSVSEGKGTSMGEGKAGRLRLRFRKRLASLLEKAVLSAPPAVPTLPQQAPGSQQLRELSGRDSPSFPSLPGLLSIPRDPLGGLGKLSLHFKHVRPA